MRNEQGHKQEDEQMWCVIATHADTGTEYLVYEGSRPDCLAVAAASDQVVYCGPITMQLAQHMVQ